MGMTDVVLDAFDKLPIVPAGTNTIITVANPMKEGV
jgi:hypothetical protein